MPINLNGNTPSTFSANIRSENEGTSGSSGQGQVVGYQQGTWTAQLEQGTIDSRNSTWTRIGNRVEIIAYLTTFSVRGTTDSVRVTNTSLPYQPVLPSENITIGSCICTRVGQQPNAVGMGTSGNIRFERTGADIDSTSRATTHDDLGAANSIIAFTASYITNDTTWTPSAGAALT